MQLVVLLECAAHLRLGISQTRLSNGLGHFFFYFNIPIRISFLRYNIAENALIIYSEEK